MLPVTTGASGGTDRVRLRGSRTCSALFPNTVGFLIEETTGVFLINPWLKKKERNKEEDNTITFASVVF